MSELEKKVNTALKEEEQQELSQNENQTEVVVAANNENDNFPKCTKCGAVLAEDQLFCPKCGTKVVVKKPKMSKKKKTAIIGSVIGVIAVALVLVVALYFFPEYIAPQINLSKAESAFDSQDYATAVEYYEKSGMENDAENNGQYTYAIAMTQYAANDYKAAAQTFSKTGGILESNAKIYDCGIALKDAEDYESAIDCFALISTDEANANKSYCEGMVAYGKKNYSEAISKFNTAKATIEPAATILPQVYYEYGVSLFDKKDYSAAATQFEKAGDYSDSKTYITGCSLMEAEDLLLDGKLNEAKTAYSKLPQDFSFKNISVTNRVNAINSASAFASICGKWSPTKNYIESRNVYKRNGSWDNWYIDETISDQSLEVNCYLNSDGTVTIKGSVSFYRFTD